MYIGIDLGTSSIKLLLVNNDGKVVKQVEKDQSVINIKPSWSEQKPQDWYDLTIEGLKELTQDEKSIEGISFSGQMHGLIIVDENDEILRNAIIWNDQRTILETQEIIDDIGQDVIFNETSNIMLTGFTAPKILWVKNHERGVFDNINKIMLPKDYLLYKFTGKYATDESDISGSLLYSVKTNKYSNVILNYLGIKESQLPKVYKSYEKVGLLNQEIVDLLKLNKAPTIVAGGGDQALGAIATGTIHEGDCSISVGTSGVVFTPKADITEIKNSGLHCFKHANGQYFLMGVTLSAAESMKWFKENFASNMSYPKIYNQIETENKNEVVFLPYLNGERTPINNPLAKGVLFGMNTTTTFSDIAQSIIEGIAFSLRDVLDKMKESEINPSTAKIIGGGVKNPKAIQIISNVLNMELYSIKDDLGPAYGACILAMVGCGRFKDVNTAINRFHLVSKMYKPSLKMLEYYNNKFLKYKEIYRNIKHLF